MNQAKKVHSHPESFQETRSSLISINKGDSFFTNSLNEPLCFSLRIIIYSFPASTESPEMPQNSAWRGREAVPGQIYLSTFLREPGPEMVGHWEKGRELQVGVRCACKNVCIITKLPNLHERHLHHMSHSRTWKKKSDGACLGMLWDRRPESTSALTNTQWCIHHPMLGTTQGTENKEQSHLTASQHCGIHWDPITGPCMWKYLITFIRSV